MAENATEKVEDVAEEGKEKVSGNGNGNETWRRSSCSRPPPVSGRSRRGTR